MGSVNTQFPPKFSLNTKNKKETAMQVRTAFEEHGFIVLKCEEGEYFNEDMMAAIEEYFSLDIETKVNSGRNGSYKTYSAPGDLGFPSYEAVTVPHSREGLEKFSRLNWPDGNDKFCETLCTTSKDLFQLAQVIMDIVVTSYGLGNEVMSSFPNAGSPCRLSRYMPSAVKGEVGLGTHIDGTYITILRQINDVQGLMLKSKHGNWLDVNLEKNSFVVFVGTMLQVWSNGKMMAPEHKIMTNEEKDRYSITLFMGPDMDEVMQAHSKFVNDENPARFKPFIYKDYLAYTSIHLSLEGTLEKYAGI